VTTGSSQRSGAALRGRPFRSGRGSRAGVTIARVSTPRILVAGLLALTLVSTACNKDVDPDEALAQGLAQQDAGNTDAAAALYQKVLDVRPDDKFANYNLGVIEQADGRTQLAEGYYRAALDTDPNFEPAMYNLATIRTAVGANQEAIDLYLRVLALDPDNTAAHFNLGILYRDAGRAKDATQHLNAALELDPSLADRLTSNPIPPAGSGSGSGASPSSTP
jgi:tetratricopeptide (TPR) repeat protein